MTSNMQITAKTKTLTRSTSAASVLTPQSHGAGRIISQKDYTLDRAKSLEKKNSGCQKEHMKCHMKSGDNIVLEFSTAAYELAKSCLHKLLSGELFPHSFEKRESLDQAGAIVDSCYKIYNKRVDGTCGKKLKFAINLYHTTSQMLVNGTKVDIFLTDIYENLCTEMKANCKHLDILNTNIAVMLNNACAKVQNNDSTQYETVEKQNLKSIDSIETESVLEQNLKTISNTEELTDCEVTELCPLCHQQAFGNTIQCVECGEWYHFECLKINNDTIQTLGDDDYVCHSCTDNILYDNPNNGDKDSYEGQLYDQSQITQTHNPVMDTASSLHTGIQDINQPNNEQIGCSPTLEVNDISKTKVKKASKSNKVKKDEVCERSYILELESQINMLKSTIELHKKREEQLNKSKYNAGQEYCSSDSCRTENACSHRCCSQLAEKIQENRLKLIETQMMQNMFINNAMHMQLSAQIRSSFQVSPVPTISPLNHGVSNAYIPTPAVGNHAYMPTPAVGNYAPYQNPAFGFQPSMVHGQAVRHVYAPQQAGPSYPVYPGSYGVRPPSYFPPTGQSQVPPSAQIQTDYQRAGHISMTRPNMAQTNRAVQPNISNVFRQSTNTQRQGNTQQTEHLAQAKQKSQPVKYGDTSYPNNTPTNVPSTENKNNEQHNARKRHLCNTSVKNDKSIQNKYSMAGGKKHCGMQNADQDRDTSDANPIVIEDGLSNTSIHKDGIEQDTSRTSSPSLKADCITTDKEREHFLAVPPIKHNPPEIVQEMHLEEMRELV